MDELVCEIAYKGEIKSRFRRELERVINADVHVMIGEVNGKITISQKGKAIFSYPLYGFGLALRHRSITDSYISEKANECCKAFMGTILAKYFY